MGQIKEKLKTAPIFALFKGEGDFIIDSDACDKQVRCVLQPQNDDGFLRPIGFWFWNLNDAKKRYDITHREFLAGVWAIMLLRPYIEERLFSARTDHHD